MAGDADMSDLSPAELERLIKKVTDSRAYKLTKWGLRWFWLAAALTAMAIILTDWRLFGLGILAVLVGGAHLMLGTVAKSPAVSRGIAERYRDHMNETS